MEIDKYVPEIKNLKSRAVITISDCEHGLVLEVKNDPEPTGPKQEWDITALMAERMIKLILEEADANGIRPGYAASKDAVTGHIDVVRRQKPRKENPNG